MNSDEKLVKQLDKLEAIAKMVDSEYITQEEMEDIVALVIAAIEASAEDFQKKVGEMSENELAYYVKCSKAIEECKAYLEDKLAKQYNYMAKVNTKDVQDAIEQTAQRIKTIKGDKGDSPTEAELVALIKPLIPKPIKGDPGTSDTPDEVVEKVNKGKVLIKKERVEGLADIERMAKANSEFNPTMGPSFSDLKRLQDQITGIGGTSQGGKVSINFIIDGGGSAITTGVKGFVEIPYNMTITGWQVFGDQSGSIVVDVWRSTYATFPPVVGGTIAGTEKPTLSSSQVNQDLTLSTWTTALSSGDVIGYNVDSVSTVTRVTVSIIGVKN